MTGPSVSFRISRHTQDLAETVHAISQRLVTMEQRLEALERHLQDLRRQPRQAQEEEAASLAPIEAHIERLLQDCRQLLADRQPGLSEVRPFGELGEASQAADTREQGAEDGDPHTPDAARVA
jgi:chromosome segregation ATPase